MSVNENALSPSIFDPAGPGIMVYGLNALYTATSPAVQRLSTMRIPLYYYNTYDRSNIQPMPYDPSKNQLGRECKAALTALVVHNFFLRQLDPTAPIIPCLFFLEGSHPVNINGPYEELQFNRRFLTEKSYIAIHEFRRAITTQEMRRAIKLMSDPSVPPPLREIAKRTFFFLKIHAEKLDREDPIEECFSPLPLERDEIVSEWELQTKYHTKLSDHPFYEQDRPPTDWRHQTREAFLRSTPPLPSESREEEKDFEDALTAIL